MMSHILDRPIWSALETAHASLAEGNALARRYPPSIVPFAASADNSPESLGPWRGCLRERRSWRSSRRSQSSFLKGW